MIKNTTLFLVCICFGMVAFADSEQTITIGTGSTSGVYYPAGGAICRAIHQRAIEKLDTGLCVVESSRGSSENAKDLDRKEVDFAILQEDVLSDAYHGVGKKFHNHPRANLRVLMRLYLEVFTVLARNSTNAKHFMDLKNKDIGVGISGSGDFNNLSRYLHYQGDKMEDFANFFYSSGAAKSRLCSDSLDASIITIGHPNTFIRRALDGCGRQLVSLSDEVIDKLIASYPTYTKATIYKGTYNNDRHINSFGVYAVLATYADMPEETVYQVTKSIFENLDMLRSAHPALKGMIFDDMVGNKSSVPIHRGALRYFKEAKLLPKK